MCEGDSRVDFCFQHGYGEAADEVTFFRAGRHEDSVEESSPNLFVDDDVTVRRPLGSTDVSSWLGRHDGNDDKDMFELPR